MATADQISEYNQQWDKAVELTLAAYNGSDWSKESSKEKDIEIFTRSVKGSSFSQVKSVVTVNAQFDQVIKQVQTTKVIDENTPKDQREGAVERRVLSNVENDPDGACFFYIIVESPSRLVSNRDFLMYQKSTNKDGLFLLVRTSINNEEMRKVAKGCVRGNMFFQSFICEKTGDNQTKLTFLCHADPSGSIPAMVYNMAATKQGLAALRIKREVEQ